ncbi:hypothetical protein SipoB123_12650 [Streptomyces ipomoeae]|nr:hypothetical protein SipoB123_12650 [Streptomyces ipomoeae]
MPGARPAGQPSLRPPASNRGTFYVGVLLYPGLICFNGAGFNDKAHAAAVADPDVRLIDLATLYGQV